MNKPNKKLLALQIANTKNTLRQIAVEKQNAGNDPARMYKLVCWQQDLESHLIALQMQYATAGTTGE